MDLVCCDKIDDCAEDCDGLEHWGVNPHNPSCFKRHDKLLSADLLSCRVGQEGRYTKIGADMIWPSYDQGEHEWRLRHGTPEQVVKERMIAASIVAAYREFIQMPQKQRNAICKALREAT